MCGIAGIVGDFDPQRKTAALAAMMSALERRGPDGAGMKSAGEAAFGHRRLAIFDLSDNGRQPMTAAGGSVMVTFNGAIYNFQNLRRELCARGYHFRSATDTEVLLHGYCEWGMPDLVKRLRGMFAFALWDNSAGKLFLVRDRLGVKPLIYAIRGDRIAFASTVRALRRAGFAGELNESALVDVLRWGYVEERHAIYHGIDKLAPATILEWSHGRTKQQRYWEAPRAASASGLDFQDAVAEAERQLLSAVSARLEADVPVGVLLSAGIDSSLICWALSKLDANLTAFTVAVPGDAGDESRAAQATARRLKLRHKIVNATAADASVLDELLAAYDEPFACASALGMLRVSRAVQSEAKVLLTGDGGDDIFLGYPRHRHLWLSERLANHAPFARALARRVLPRRGALRRACAMLDYAAEGLPAYFAPTVGLAAYRERRLLTAHFDRVANFPTRNGCSAAPGLVENLVAFERQGRFVGEYLKKIDGATMHYGLEARSPFLDQELWEFAGSLPVDLRLHGGRLKALLREIARRRLGMSVALRKKRGFSIPVLRWLVREWRGRARDLFHDSQLARAGWIERGQLLKEFENAVERGEAPAPLWHILVLENWLQRERHEQSRFSANSAAPARAACESQP